MLYPNSTKLLVSGGVLHNFIEQTFEQFKNVYVKTQQEAPSRKGKVKLNIY